MKGFDLMVIDIPIFSLTIAAQTMIDIFDPANPLLLRTLGGAATAVWVITSVVGYLFEGRNTKNIKKWLALVLAIGISLFGTTYVENANWQSWVVSIINGFIIYVAAVGVNVITAVVGRPPPQVATFPEGVENEFTTSSIQPEKAPKTESGFRESWW